MKVAALQLSHMTGMLAIALNKDSVAISSEASSSSPSFIAAIQQHAIIANAVVCFMDTEPVLQSRYILLLQCSLITRLLP